MSAIESLPEFRQIDDGLLRFMTCGSVDDGKSTLIGRLLFDTKAILADTLHAIEKTSARRGLTAADLSLLTDGLQAEREQGITIDVAYRYFSTGRRKYIIADAPGHEQYTRNMVTAASTADLAIILVDARNGVQAQTRRHSKLAHMMGIRHLIVAVNKMDLVDYAEEAFRIVEADYLHFAARSGIDDVRFVPMSAVNGDMVVERGDRMSWYDGPTLLEELALATPREREVRNALRLPVQYVCRPQQADDPALHDFRGYMGRIESGSIAAGDVVTILPGGRRTRVRAIRLGDGSLDHAIAGQSVTVLLEDDIDISRGDLIVGDVDAPDLRDVVRADVCWLSESPLDARRTYAIRLGTRTVRARLAAIHHCFDIHTLEQRPATALQVNDIGELSFKLAQPVAADRYADNPATGSFIVIDEATNNTVGAGMVV